MAYTNHTLLPEALERWPVRLFRAAAAAPAGDHLRDQRPLPGAGGHTLARRHASARRACPSSRKATSRMVRMAYLAIVGSFSVNGVAELHSRLLQRGPVPRLLRAVAGASSTTRPTASRRGAGWPGCNPGLRDSDHRDRSATAGSRDLDASARTSRRTGRRSGVSADAGARSSGRTRTRLARHGRSANAASTSTPTRCSTCRSSASTSTSASC